VFRPEKLIHPGGLFQPDVVDLNHLPEKTVKEKNSG
jgi:hypothetical protein